ncbi:lysophospholipid acyltransferase family protein [Prochlorococcus marinus]|uniref:1-acyl-sn-glycerol-3-phosphate acyltransferase n=1 Tax=Prochlorococcus marinus XMU1408 TaxID=2213228 RepID=A0A318R201_PROMR|nr:lysophospholipid acyltransferase family protein [Prochlorococcus marinus]MBW3042247.1 1-acyl-sn-glycerol-3-phosphate acyltransferase [Prochlorococcus marinus str. XMU1408]PYE01636.1 1-acyl-sn-glycerol-3-phosphate acyltransferase [Prochlorococcus marinus XMU1408]
MPLLQREKKICLGVDPFWSRLAMVATQDIALNNFFKRRIVIGAENLPLSGSVVLAPTHRSRWDALMLTMAAGRRVTHRDCRYMVTRSEMKGLQGWFLNRLGCFPIDQGRPSLPTLRYAVDLLVSRQQLVVFPEGRINRFSEPVRLKKGLIRLAQLASHKGFDIKIVPVGLAYSEVMPRFLGSASICFSKPIIISKDFNQSTSDFNIDLSRSMSSAERLALLAVGRS